MDGLTLNDIAIIRGSPVGTVKARLHHARARLRAALLAKLAEIPRNELEGEVAMVEVSVHDVLLRSPKAGDAKWLAQGKDYKLGLMRVILLKERSGDRVYPIWVGLGEGDYIAMLLEKLSFVRPTPWDLATRLLEFGAMKIEQVTMTALRDNIYYASISVQSPGGLREMDARPSDAISIALLTDAPIFVNPEAFKETEIENAARAIPELEEANNKVIAEGRVQPDPVEMKWQSFRSLPRDEPEWLKSSS